jgi:hypothetical protein
MAKTSRFIADMMMAEAFSIGKKIGPVSLPIR